MVYQKKIEGNGFMNRKIRQIICVILSLICVVSIWYKPVLANEKSSNYSDIDSQLYTFPRMPTTTESSSNS